MALDLPDWATGPVPVSSGPVWPAEQPKRRRTFLRFHKRQPERRIVENYHLGPVPKDEEPEVGVCKIWVNGQQS